jgi:prolyl oligopeptidase
VKKRQPPKQQPFLVVLESLDAPDTGKVVLDPTVLDPSGTTALDWYVPSPDGRLVAVSLSKGGTESGDVSVLEVDTGKTIDARSPG